MISETQKIDITNTHIVLVIVAHRDDEALGWEGQLLGI